MRFNHHSQFSFEEYTFSSDLRKLRSLISLSCFAEKVRNATDPSGAPAGKVNGSEAIFWDLSIFIAEEILDERDSITDGDTPGNEEVE
jgi:hypothetical protein